MPVLLAFGVTAKIDVSDYFPLKTGTKWVYIDSSEGQSATYTDSVGNVQSVGGRDAVPIVTKIKDEVDGSTFYRVEGDQVLLVAFDQNNPLASPYPILMFGDGKNNWSYTGSTQWLGAPAPMTMKGSCRRAGSREVLGETREIIEATVDVVIGPERGVNMKSHEVSVYAKGVGLISLKGTTTYNKQKSERSKTIVSFTPASGT
ncbi:MAG: hypothetical protein JSS66_09975 [Armatimonadetes bacterium]|nr:hypothetical protein [Armatimonadota bacterium]